MKKMKVLALALACVPLFCGFLTIEINEDNFFVCHPTFPFPEREYKGLKTTTRVIRTPDGKELHGVIFSVAASDKWVLYFTGVGEAAYDDIDRLYFFARELGVNVACFDRRCYGRSTGRSNFDNLRSDSLLVYDTVKNEFNPKRLVVVGHSLGSVAAQWIAANRPLDGAVLESVFTNAAEAIPGLPKAAMWPFNLILAFKPSPRVTALKPQPEELIKSVTCPLLILHGGKDMNFPPEMAKRMLELAGSREKELMIAEEDGHFVEYGKPPVKSALKAFVEGGKTRDKRQK